MTAGVLLGLLVLASGSAYATDPGAPSEARRAGSGVLGAEGGPPPSATPPPEALASGRASGFVFEHADGNGLAWAVERALDLHADRRRWDEMVKRAMAQDWSWDKSAREYLALYRRLVDSPPVPVHVP